MQAISRILGPLTVLATLALATAAHAAPADDFSSSFEPGDPQPAWTNTAERSSGVSGPRRSGIPGNVTDRVVAVRASGENTNGGEVKENLVDGSAETKWLVFATTGWVELELAEPVAVVHYALTSANDAAERDPRDWTLQGSNDGQTWTTLDTQTDQIFAERFQKREYRFANTTAYRHYRLNITRNSGANIVQLAEIELSNGDTTPPPPSDMRTIAGAGPRGGYNAKAGAGWTGLKALEYAGQHTAEGRGYSYNKVFDVDVRVRRETELSYLIYPRFITDDLSYPSTYAAVDLAFTDGTYLSQLRAATSTARSSARAARAARRRSTRTSGTSSARGSGAWRPARPSTASSSPTTTRTGRPTSRAGSTTSRSTAARSRGSARSRRTGS